MKQALVVGCGLSRAIITLELAKKDLSDFIVKISKKRSLIAGNMYDSVDEYGILVHKYSLHTLHTRKKELHD